MNAEIRDILHAATPLPWGVDRMNFLENVFVRHIGKSSIEGLLVATCQEPEDAIYITKACNEYPELVHKLDKYEGLLRYLWLVESHDSLFRQKIEAVYPEANPYIDHLE